MEERNCNFSFHSKIDISYHYTVQKFLETMVKGYRKRKLAGIFFKAKHPPTWRRTHSEDSCSGPSHCEDQCSTSRYNLRQRSQPEDNDLNLGNRIIHLQLLVAMMNTISSDHLATGCSHIDLQLHSEMKRGLGSQFIFECRSCGYMSSKLNTYRTIPGTKRCAINTVLAGAILDTPMGITRTEQLFTQLDIPFPAASYLQKLTNELSSEVVQMNKEDMAEKRRLVEEHTRQTGAQHSKMLDLSIDARYNSSRMKSSYKPGQSSSQAYTVAIENNTNKQYIVGLSVENKLCWTGRMLQNKGFTVSCPGHAGCTADISYFTPHSERRMAYDIADSLYSDGYFVRTLTTDGDSRSYLGMQDFYDKLDIAWDVTRQADPNHLAATQERRLRMAAFSQGMFPNNSKAGKKRAQAVFARDVKSRCNAVIEEMARRGKGDITESIVSLPDIRKATIECYAGNCSMCPESALVCSGEGVNCWWYKSQILGPNNINHLHMDENDKSLLSVILQMRLSEAAIYKVSSRTSTQKCEAFNRAALSTMPKSQNYPKTFAARLALQTMRANNSVENAVRRKIDRLAHTKLCESALRRLRHISSKAHSHKVYKRTKRYKMRRIARRAQMEMDFRMTREHEPDYIKGILDDNHHSYASTSAKGH